MSDSDWQPGEVQYLSGGPTVDGRQLRDEGIARVAVSAGEDWNSRYDAEVMRRIGMGQVPGNEFTSEDITDVVGWPSADHRASGRMGMWARRGLIEKCGERQVRRPEAHARPLTVWRPV